MKPIVLLNKESGRIYLMSRLVEYRYSEEPIPVDEDGSVQFVYYFETEFEGTSIGTMTQNCNLDDFEVLGEL